MTAETKTIEVQAYRDAAGKPCCAANFKTGEVCPFYRTRTFGTKEICIFNDDVLLRRRGEFGLGTLVPFAGCPVWKGEEAK